MSPTTDPEELGIASSVMRTVQARRPSSRFEEDLLLRAIDEYERLQEVGVAEPDPPAVLLDAIEEDDAPDEGTLQRSYPLFLAVAAVVVLMAVGWLVAQPNAERARTADIPAPEIVGASAIDRANAACAKALPEVGVPTLEVIDTQSIQSIGPRAAEDVSLIVESLLGALDGDPSTPQIIEALEDLSDEIANAALLLENGETDPPRYSIPSASSQLLEVLNELSERGAASCEKWE